MVVMDGERGFKEDFEARFPGQSYERFFGKDKNLETKQNQMVYRQMHELLKILGYDDNNGTVIINESRLKEDLGTHLFHNREVVILPNFEDPSKGYRLYSREKK